MERVEAEVVVAAVGAGTIEAAARGIMGTTVVTAMVVRAAAAAIDAATPATAGDAAAATDACTADASAAEAAVPRDEDAVGVVDNGTSLITNPVAEWLLTEAIGASRNLDADVDDGSCACVRGGPSARAITTGVVVDAAAPAAPNGAAVRAPSPLAHNCLSHDSSLPCHCAAAKAAAAAEEEDEEEDEGEDVSAEDAAAAAASSPAALLLLYKWEVAGAGGGGGLRLPPSSE